MNSNPCPVKQRLAVEMHRTHEALIELGNQDVQAVLTGDWVRRDQIGVLIQRARLARRNALEAYRIHVTEHAC